MKLNIAQVEKAIDTAKTASTGARERYRRKKLLWSLDFCIVHSPKLTLALSYFSAFDIKNTKNLLFIFEI
jgi:hypothetical protein